MKYHYKFLRISEFNSNVIIRNNQLHVDLISDVPPELSVNVVVASLPPPCNNNTVKRSDENSEVVGVKLPEYEPCAYN